MLALLVLAARDIQQERLHQRDVAPALQRCTVKAAKAAGTATEQLAKRPLSLQDAVKFVFQGVEK